MFHPNLEVVADLGQKLPGLSDVVGGHHLPLQDGQRNVWAGRQVHVCDWLEADGRNGQAVRFRRSLELGHLHVRYGLRRQKQKLRATVERRQK